MNEVKIEGNVAKYYFTAPRKLIRFWKTEQAPFWVEYPEGMNLNDCPRGIMMVPFVGCMLSVAMILKLKIEVPEIDETFLESLPGIREAYKRMFPYSNFIFDVKAQNVVSCYRDCAPAI